MIKFHRLITPGDVPTATTFTDNDGSEGGIILQVADGLIYTLDNNGDVISIGGGGGGASDFVTIQNDVVAEANQGYLVKTSTGVHQITLPSDATLKQGTSVSVGDYDGEAFTNSIVITTSDGSLINGVDESFELNIDYAVLTFSYVEAENDWRIVNGAGESSPPSFIAKDTVFEDVVDETTFAPTLPFRFESGGGDVYYNTGRLIEGSNYSINTDGSITLSEPVGSADDVITLRVYNRLESTDLTPLYDRVDSLEENNPNTNLLDNANFAVAQRAGVQAAGVNPQFYLDRWRLRGTSQVGGSYDVHPTVAESRTYMATVHTNPTAHMYAIQRVELKNENPEDIVGRDITISFETRFDVPLDCQIGVIWYNVTVNDQNDSWPYSRSEEFSVPSGFTTFSKTLTIPQPDAGFMSDNKYALTIILDYGLNGTLATGAYRFYNAKAEYGNQFTGFTRLHPAEDLARCQRYFYSSKGGSSEVISPTVIANTVTGTFSATLPFPVPMRAVPTVTTEGVFRIYGANSSGSNINDLADVASVAGGGGSRNSVTVNLQAATVPTTIVGAGVFRTTGAGAFYTVSAEI